MPIKLLFLLLGLVQAFSCLDARTAFSQHPEEKKTTEEIFFQEIPSVFGASKFEQKQTEAPSSITILTQNEIKKFGYRTLGDVLRSVRGFFVNYDRNYSYIGVRGFGRPGDYNTRILLLVDGHRINDNIYETAPVGTDFPVDLDLVDRVEIIRGPSSSIYGANAFFGVINVITKRGRDLKGPEISGEAGRHDTYKGRASYGERYSNGAEVLISGSHYRSDGQDLFFNEFNHPSTNRGIAHDLDWDRYHQFFSKASMRDFTIQGIFSSRDKGIPAAPWEVLFNDPAASTTDTRAYLDLKYEHSFSNGLTVMSRAFYDQYKYDGTYPYKRENPGPLPPIFHSLDSGLGDWWGMEFQATRKLFENHKLVMGTEFRDNFRQNQRQMKYFPRSVDFESAMSSLNWGAYIEDQYHILDNLILNAGARYDRFEAFGGTVNPRAALIYNPVEKTALKLIYGEAFRAPNVYELYYNDGETVKAALSLEPEKVHTYEAVWEQYIGDHHRMTSSIYYFTVNNLINLQQDTDGFLVFRNMDRVNAYGFEWEFESKWKCGIESRLSYAFQQARNDLDDSILTNSPFHQGKLNIIFPLYRDRVLLGTEFQYMSPRKTLAGQKTDNVFLTNLTLFTQKFMSGMEVSATVYNIFNQKYGDPGSEEHLQDILYQDGINFRVKVTYSF